MTYETRERVCELNRKINAINASLVRSKQAGIRIALMRATIAKLESL